MVWATWQPNIWSTKVIVSYCMREIPGGDRTHYVKYLMQKRC